MAQIQPVFMSPDDKRAALLGLTTAQRMLEQLRLRVIAGAGDVAEADGARDVAAWLASKTKAHHLKPWAEGGKTDLKHGRLYCCVHHHRAHDPRFTMERLPNGDYRFYRRT